MLMVLQPINNKKKIIDAFAHGVNLHIEPFLIEYLEKLGKVFKKNNIPFESLYDIGMGKLQK